MAGYKKFQTALFLILILFCQNVWSEENVPNGESTDDKGKKQVIIKLKPFFIADNLLQVSGISINSINGFADFNIINKTKKNLVLLFAKVFRFEQKDNEKRNFTLINNPNKPGILISGARHLPGKTAVWRFSLYKSMLIERSEFRYIIDVNKKSLFYE